MCVYYYELIQSFRDYQFSRQFRVVRETMLSLILGRRIQAPGEPSGDTTLTDVILPYLEKIKFSPKLVSYFRVVRRDGAPYRDIDLLDEPKQVSQLKKIINALYYAELAFEELEQWNLDQPSGYGNLLFKRSWKTVANSYKAIRLATKLDVELDELFEPQLAALLPVLELFSRFAPDKDNLMATVQAPEVDAFKKLLLRNPAYYAGKGAGTVIAQLPP